MSSVDKTREILKTRIEYETGWDQMVQDVAVAAFDGMKVLALRVAALESNWISVEDHLPDVRVYVLVWNERGVSPAYWTEERKFWGRDIDGYLYGVRFWRPMLAPPKLEK